MTPRDMQRSRLELLILLMIVAVGAFFRLYGLGDSALRADTIQFWRWCNSDLSAGQMLARWLEMQVDQLPLPLVLTKFMLDTLHLPITHFTVRLPNALFGIALVPVMYAAGRRLGGVVLGGVAALLMAVNPFNIQISGEAYFYSSAMLGAGLMFWGVLAAAEDLQGGRVLSRTFFWTSGSGFFCMAYSQWTALGAAAVFMGIVLVLLLRAPVSRPARIRALGASAVLYGLIGAPLVLAPWGLPYLFAKINSPQKALGAKAVEVAGENAWSLVVRTVGAFGWGGTPLRLGLTLLVAVLGLLALWRFRRNRPELWLIPAALAGTVLLFLLSRGAIGAMYESRYLGGLLPVYTILLALGLVEGLRACGVKAEVVRRLGPALALLGAAWNMPAAYACTQLTGKPTPYRAIVAWADTNLPPGTPVLVDRWFESWNEFVPYPSSTAIFTFTIPNEPLDTYLRGHWRDTAMDFFARNPDAAYLEVAKTYFEVPAVGYWHWPRQAFARHVAITNEAGLLLRRLGQAARGDYFSATTNRIIAEYFYNTREDVMRQRAAAGQRVLAYFGAGWGFEKTGPMGIFRIQTQDFRDWRRLDGTAVLELINLTPKPISAQIILRGAAVNGAKTVNLSPSSQHTFPVGRVESWTLGPLDLQPGVNSLTLRDTLWDASRNPLLLESVVVREVAAAKVVNP